MDLASIERRHIVTCCCCKGEGRRGRYKPRCIKRIGGGSEIADLRFTTTYYRQE